MLMGVITFYSKYGIAIKLDKLVARLLLKSLILSKMHRFMDLILDQTFYAANPCNIDAIHLPGHGLCWAGYDILFLI